MDRVKKVPNDGKGHPCKQSGKWFDENRTKTKSLQPFPPHRRRNKRRAYVLPYWINPESKKIHVLVAVQIEDTKKYPNTYTYSLLGGACEEASPQMCAVRELCEETGGYLSLDLHDVYRLPPNQRYSGMPDLIWISPITDLDKIRTLINEQPLRNNPQKLSPKCAENSFVDLLPLDFLVKLSNEHLVECHTYAVTRKEKIPYSLYPKFRGNSKEDYLEYFADFYCDGGSECITMGVWYTLANVVDLLSDDEMKEALRVLYNASAIDYKHRQKSEPKCNCTRKV